MFILNKKKYLIYLGNSENNSQIKNFQPCFGNTAFYEVGVKNSIVAP